MGTKETVTEMELYIETLTGTFFELRVSPFETIMSVKAKIQRLEGIPIAQQHLIWQSMELEDDYCLHDYSIHDGATLKLVLAMRGGPINTRRIPMEDPTLREMAEYVEANRDEIWEKVPGNRQVTLLVFREGDQLNFFRVVDRGDGTLTPLSESLSGASMYNFNDEEDDDDAPPKEKVEENEQLKEKMKTLRGKMEKLTLKKPRKKPRPPSTGHSTRLRQLPGSGRALGHLNRNMCLPPVGHTRHSPLTMDDRTNLIEPLSLSTFGEQSRSAKSSRSGKLVDNTECLSRLSHTLASVQENSSVKEASTDIKVKEDQFQTTALSEKTVDKSLSKPEENISKSDSEKPLSETKTEETLPTTSSPCKKDSVLSANSLSKKDSVLSVNSLGKKDSVPTSSSSKKDYGSDNSKETNKPSTSKAKQLLKNDLTIENLKEVLGRPNTSSRDLMLESLQETFGRPTTSSRYKGLERRKEFTLESLSTSEARAMSGLLRQASLEKIGSSRIGNFTGSKSRLGNYNIGPSVQDGRITTPEGRLVSARLQRVASSRDGRLLSPSHRLPPVKSKKKAAKRCFVCAKKTGLATSYICRCGNNFCATHRYAESHECTFDYKTEGRKLLEQSNPVVSAPKLPKI